MPFGKCHAFTLPLVDFSQFVNCIRIPLTFTGHFNKGQPRMWSRCWGKCSRGVWSLAIAAPAPTLRCLSSENGWPSSRTSKSTFMVVRLRILGNLRETVRDCCFCWKYNMTSGRDRRSERNHFPSPRTLIWIVALKHHLRNHVALRKWGLKGARAGTSHFQAGGWENGLLW